MKRSTLLLTVCVWALAGVALAEPKSGHGYLVVSDGLKIHYVVVGRGTPVILIHGAGGSAEGNWFANGIARALAKNHRVVAIDCRGHGKSDNPPGGPMPNRKMAEDVIELMNHLDIATAHVHGFSRGGAIAEQMLARYPERFLTYGHSHEDRVRKLADIKLYPSNSITDDGGPAATSLASNLR